MISEDKGGKQRLLLHKVVLALHNNHQLMLDVEERPYFWKFQTIELFLRYKFLYVSGLDYPMIDQSIL